MARALEGGAIGIPVIVYTGAARRLAGDAEAEGWDLALAADPGAGADPGPSTMRWQSAGYRQQECVLLFAGMVESGEAAAERAGRGGWRRKATFRWLSTASASAAAKKS